MSQTAFSLLVSFLLLIAGFLLGVLANIVTPKFQNWWAALSLNRLKKRIETLRAEADELKFMEPISIVDSEILASVERIERYILLILIFLVCMAYAGLWMVNKLVPPTTPFSWTRFCIVAGIGVIVFIAFVKVFSAESAARFFRSEETAWRLIADMKELETKLEKWKSKQ